MVRLVRLSNFFLILFIILILVSAGCIQPKSPTSTSSSSTPAKTAVPGAKTTIKGATGDSNLTLLNGSLFISSNPVGADVYLNETYRGSTPINLTELYPGTYNLSVVLKYYSISNGTVQIKSGQTTKLSRTLTAAAPKIAINIVDASVSKNPPCLYSFTGTIVNTGDATLYETIITLKMTPLKTEATDTGTKYITISSPKSLGQIRPGESIPFSYDNVAISCNGNYKAEMKWEGVDRVNPDIFSDDKKVSGTISL